MPKKSFSLKFSMENAAFDAEFPGNEVARILCNLANFADIIRPDDVTAGSVFDVNGNYIGTWEADTREG